MPPTVGTVMPNHAAHGRLFPGDRVMAINGEDIGTFDELRRIVAKNPSKPLRFKVFRDNKHVEVEVVAEETVERGELDIVTRQGTIGISSSAAAAVIGVPQADSPAYRAGLRTFDMITSVGGRPVRRFMDLEKVLSENPRRDDAGDVSAADGRAERARRSRQHRRARGRRRRADAGHERNRSGEPDRARAR
jgi:regulator of sigma E protease